MGSKGKVHAWVSCVWRVSLGCYFSHAWVSAVSVSDMHEGVGILWDVSKDGQHAIFFPGINLVGLPPGPLCSSLLLSMKMAPSLPFSFLLVPLSHFQLFPPLPPLLECFPSRN